MVVAEDGAAHDGQVRIRAHEVVGALLDEIHKLMGVLTPRPSQVIARFQERYAQSPRAATDWYYTFSQDTDYIRRYRNCLTKSRSFRKVLRSIFMGVWRLLKTTVLPARLKGEMARLGEVLVSGGDPAADPELVKHAEWDLNPRPLGPEPSALPAALHPDLRRCGR